MKYVSTRGGAPAVNFKRALFTGLAPNGGLYVPDRVPYFTQSGLVQMKDISYVRMALSLIYPFVAENILFRDFSRILNNSIKVFPKQLPPSLSGVPSTINTSGNSGSSNSDKKIHPVPAPLRILGDNLSLLELYHGPSLSFKDFALNLLSGLMDHFIKEDSEKGNKRKILILGATSGDTGSAAIEAFRHYPDIKMVILHPHNKITPFQRQQMTTTGAENVWNIAVEGNFDDCQQLVKDCFNGRDFLPPEYNLTAINSINWARVIAQIVYYFSAFFQLGCDFKRKYCFTVPTGNFGNVLAGYYAKCMGLPIDKLLVAVNENDILHRVFTHGDYRITEMKPTYSPSMDILVSSNFERLLFLLNSSFQSRTPIANNLFMNGLEASSKRVSQIMHKFEKENKFHLKDKIWNEARKTFLSDSCSDKETLETIAQIYRDYGIVVDPHTAVGLKAALSLRETSLKDVCNIVLSTAHPAKFTEVLSLADVPLPPNPLDQNRGVEQGSDPKKKKEPIPEKFEILSNNLSQIQDYLLSQVLK